MRKGYVDYVVEEALAVVTIDHPPVNALNRATWARIGEIFDELMSKDTVRTVIVTGAGEKAFVAGADITELPHLRKSDGEAYSRLCQESMNKVEFFQWPVVAAVNGVALGGGCELMMACDIRLASENARFGLPEINLGIIPGAGGTQRMSRIVPIGYAKLLVMTGDRSTKRGRIYFSKLLLSDKGRNKQSRGSESSSHMRSTLAYEDGTTKINLSRMALT